MLSKTACVRGTRMNACMRVCQARDVYRPTHLHVHIHVYRYIQWKEEEEEEWFFTCRWGFAFHRDWQDLTRLTRHGQAQQLREEEEGPSQLSLHSIFGEKSLFSHLFLRLFLLLLLRLVACADCYGKKTQRPRRISYCRMLALPRLPRVKSDLSSTPRPPPRGLMALLLLLPWTYG